MYGGNPDVVSARNFFKNLEALRQNASAQTGKAQARKPSIKAQTLTRKAQTIVPATIVQLVANPKTTINNNKNNNVRTRKNNVFDNENKSIIDTENQYLLNHKFFDIASIKVLSSFEFSTGSLVISVSGINKLAGKTFAVKYTGINGNKKSIEERTTNECVIYKYIKQLVKKKVLPFVYFGYFCENINDVDNLDFYNLTNQNDNFKTVNVLITETNLVCSNKTVETTECVSIEALDNYLFKLHKSNESKDDLYYKNYKQLLLIILFQTMYSLKVFETVGLQHNDLNNVNTLVLEYNKGNNTVKTKNKYITITNKGKKKEFNIPNYGIEIRIFDFDFAQKYSTNKVNSNLNDTLKEEFKTIKNYKKLDVFNGNLSTENPNVNFDILKQLNDLYSLINSFDDKKIVKIYSEIINKFSKTTNLGQEFENLLYIDELHNPESLPSKKLEVKKKYAASIIDDAGRFASPTFGNLKSLDEILEILEAEINVAFTGVIPDKVLQTYSMENLFKDEFRKTLEPLHTPSSSPEPVPVHTPLPEQKTVPSPAPAPKPVPAPVPAQKPEPAKVPLPVHTPSVSHVPNVNTRLNSVKELQIQKYNTAQLWNISQFVYDIDTLLVLDTSLPNLTIIIVKKRNTKQCEILHYIKSINTDIFKNLCSDFNKNKITQNNKTVNLVCEHREITRSTQLGEIFPQNQKHNNNKQKTNTNIQVLTYKIPECKTITDLNQLLVLYPETYKVFYNDIKLILGYKIELEGYNSRILNSNKSEWNTESRRNRRQTIFAKKNKTKHYLNLLPNVNIGNSSNSSNNVNRHRKEQLKAYQIMLEKNLSTSSSSNAKTGKTGEFFGFQNELYSRNPTQTQPTTNNNE
jgi:hypothetical protein